MTAQTMTSLRQNRRRGAAMGRALAAVVASLFSLAEAQALTPAAARPPEDDIIYFALPDRFANDDTGNDRGGLAGGRLENGYDPTAKGFYHGGDLRGLTKKLDYIQRLGATAVWLAPIFVNKPVQGPIGDESAGYHGYWITDFLNVDPHLGTRADFKALVDAAHARGLKVILDIVINHTADVIVYKECPVPDAPLSAQPKGGCAYRSKADYPYARRGGVSGAAINDGFLGDQPPFQTTGNFSRLTRPDYALTPYLRPGEEHVKSPAWLNDLRFYHNRGDSNWRGESSTYGDFVGLDDLMTEDPRVIQGFIDIYGKWIEDFKLDGYRIDTERHVNAEFWQAFVPAILTRAKAAGVPHFYIFGEVADDDPAGAAAHTRVDALPSALDFGFHAAVVDVVANGVPTDRLARVFAADPLYEGGAEAALRLPTFVSNHDAGRIGHFILTPRRGADGNAAPPPSRDEALKRSVLAQAMMFYLRGVPTVYYGDEQGFTGDGGDQDARQDMFPSKVASYNDDVQLGAAKTTAADNFDTNHPLYKAIARMARDRGAIAALRHGRQIVRHAEADGGVFAASRLDGDAGEYLVVFNAEARDRRVDIAVDPRSLQWSSVEGACPAAAAAPGVAAVALPALSFIVCRSNAWRVEQQEEKG